MLLEAQDEIVKIANAILKNGYFPGRWKRADFILTGKQEKIRTIDR